MSEDPGLNLGRDFELQNLTLDSPPDHPWRAGANDDDDSERVVVDQEGAGQAKEDEAEFVRWVASKEQEATARKKLEAERDLEIARFMQECRCAIRAATADAVEKLDFDKAAQVFPCVYTYFCLRGCVCNKSRICPLCCFKSPRWPRCSAMSCFPSHSLHLGASCWAPANGAIQIAIRFQSNLPSVRDSCTQRVD